MSTLLLYIVYKVKIEGDYMISFEKEREYRSKLLHCKNIEEFLSMFFGLPLEFKKKVLSGNYTIPKGTILYRIMRDEGTDYSEEKFWFCKDWKSRNNGRFHMKGDFVLYVGKEEDVLIRECKLNKGDAYWIATYMVNKDFDVSSLLGNNNIILYFLHQVCMSIKEKDYLQENEYKMVENYLCKYSKNVDLSKVIKNKDILLPLYLYKELKRPLYEITYKIGNILLTTNKNGIRYASAYKPFELSGSIRSVTMCGEEYANFMLTKEGEKYLDFIDAKLKKVEDKLDISNVIEAFIDTLN